MRGEGVGRSAAASPGPALARGTAAPGAPEAEGRRPPPRVWGEARPSPQKYGFYRDPTSTLPRLLYEGGVRASLAETRSRSRGRTIERRKESVRRCERCIVLASECSVPNKVSSRKAARPSVPAERRVATEARAVGWCRCSASHSRVKGASVQPDGRVLHWYAVRKVIPREQSPGSEKNCTSCTRPAQTCEPPSLREVGRTLCVDERATNAGVQQPLGFKM